MADAVIRARDLTKHYGQTVGIEALYLDVQPGEVFGFLGPNGAGKTTTIRMLVDLLRPTRGSVEVLGMDPRSGGVEVRRRVGYLPGDLAPYRDLTVGQHLSWFAELRGMHDLHRVGQLCERLELDATKPVRALSTGNRQKVGIVLAFMHDPELLVLDEPTRGLDPLVQQEFHRLVRETRDSGRTVFLSSHVLDEVEQVADRVGIVRAGELVAVETLSSLKARTATHLEFRFASPVPAERFEGLAGVQQAEIDGTVGRFVVEGSADALVKAAAQFEVVSVSSDEPELEEIFLSFYSGEEQR